MKAILKKEFSSYFYTPIGYIYIAIFYFLCGTDLYLSSLKTGYADISGIFLGTFLMSTMLLPLITMRMFSTEKKNKTDQLLLSAPVKPMEIVLGKYFAGLLVFLLSISVLLIYALVFSFYSTIDGGVVFASFLGLFLMGAALISVGMYISLLTKSQMIAAVITVAVMLFLSRSDVIATLVNIPLVSGFLYGLSLYEKYFAFTQGIISVSNIFYFVSITLLFLMLTKFRLENEKYRS